MKQAFYKNRWLWISFLILVSAACLLQTLAVLTAYSASSNYFDSSSPLPIFAFFCTLAAAVIGTVAAWRVEPAPASATPFWRSSLPAPALVGFLLAALAIFFSNNTMTHGIIRPVAVAALIIAAIYAALVQIDFCRRHRVPAVLAGFGAILACILIDAYYYFDVSVEMNAAFKTATQTAILFLLLYLTAELRYLFSDPQQRIYLSLSAWTIAFGAPIALAVPVAYLTGKLGTLNLAAGQYGRFDYLAGALLMLTAIVTIILRIRALLDPRHKLEEAESIRRMEAQSATPLWAVSSDPTEEGPDPESETEAPADMPDFPDDQNETDRKDQP